MTIPYLHLKKFARRWPTLKGAGAQYSVFSLKLSNIRQLVLLLLTLSVPGFASFQAPDSLSRVPDSLKTGTDTTLLKKNETVKSKTDIDSVVYTKANDSLFFFVQEKKMSLYGSGDLRYKETNLKSGNIQVDFVTKNVDAIGVYKDSSSKEAQETPVLVDKGEEYRGTRMRYNFKTTRGFITFAATKNKAEEAAYSGAKINKIDKSTFFVENGIYTTCDEKDPHYCFVATEMKVIQKEQMVGKWVWLTFGGVPFPIPLPFVVVPLQSGRRSGLIAPAYGERENMGKSFTHFGYFWAMNDYMDLALTGDYYTKGGYGLQSRYRYSSRYNYSGYFQGSFSRIHQGETSDPDYTKQQDWQLDLVHSQTLTPSSRFDANLHFMTQNYYKLNSTSYSDILNNEINSSATYFTQWEESGTSLSMSYSRRQIIASGHSDETLPAISFSKSQVYPFKRSKAVDDEKWYELIGINYSANLQNNRKKDETGLAIRGGIQHNLNMGASPKMGYFNIAPSISYRELWYNKRVVKRVVRGFGSNDSTVVDSVITDDMNQLNFVRTYGLGVSASTKVYGIVQPQFAGIAAIRHIFSPSISYNFTPDFSKSKWNYYDEYTKSDGTKVKYNKFEREIYGGASSGESQTMSFNMSNAFEMKTMVDPRDTTSKENKIQLLNLDGGVSYNFSADSNRFSDVNISYRTQIGSLFNLSGSSRYSLYSYNEQGVTTRHFLINDRNRLLRLTNFSFSASLTLAGSKIETESGEQKQNADTAGIDKLFTSQDTKTYKGLFESVPADFSIPWNLSLSYNYSLSKYNPLIPATYSTVYSRFDINITPKWKFSVTGCYDINNKQFAAPQVEVTRDLHCWLMNFTWNPIGQYTGYRFEIRVKAPQLQDLKVTKAEQFFGGR